MLAQSAKGKENISDNGHYWMFQRKQYTLHIDPVGYIPNNWLSRDGLWI